MNRPLAWVAAAMLTGTLCAAWGLLPGLAIPLLLVAAACLAGAFRLRNARIRPFVVLVGFIGAGAAHWELNQTPNSDPFADLVANNPVSVTKVEGTVRSVTLSIPGEDRLRLILDIDTRIDNKTSSPIAGRAVIHWTRSTGLIFPGDRILVEGEASVAIAEVNPGVNGYEDYLRNRGVNTAIDAAGPKAVTRLGEAPWYLPWNWAARFRQAQADNLARAMPERVLPFVYAVWLGHQSALSQEEYLDYVWSGTAHILSVSGVHAAIIAFTLNFALRALLMARRPRSVMVMSAVFAYALVSGASVPAMRAAIMVCLYMSADLLEREPDTTTALSLAGIIFMLWDPRSVFDIGFQLSFASVASILIFISLFQNRMEKVHWFLRGPIATSLAVQIIPLPIAAASFHALPLAAPVANLVAIPVLAAVLWLCFVTALLSFIWMPAAQIAGYATLLPIELIRWIAEAGSSLRPLSKIMTTPTTHAWAMYWIAASLLAATLVVRKDLRKSMLILSTTAFAFSFIFWRPLDYEPEVVMLDVGHGDATFIRSTTGETLLIDGGDASEFSDRGRQIVAPFLWARGVTRLDAVMASHTDRDHLGGLLYIIDNFDVGAAMLGALESDRPLEREFVARCAERGVPILRVKRGDALQVGNTGLPIFHPLPDWSETTLPNDLSIVTKLDFASTSFLFTGDIERAAEASLDLWSIDTDILKVPHHGADTSSTIPFINAVTPKYATISTGSHGRKVMDQPIVDRYKALGVSVLRTDRLGAIRFALVEGQLHVESERAKRGYPIAKD
ncbi:MAG: DNA internalization-related competence protein ComEC/Rec2 [Candidatus Hydrogenedentes bacterium]|nr:DNA internalization-related competence protein ComEC/Rec2 [Candidatus Hydrogenedentota bacterium]